MRGKRAELLLFDDALEPPKKVCFKNTGEVLDEWDFEKCKDLNTEINVTLEPDEVKKNLKFLA